jgi:hypothetical protein
MTEKDTKDCVIFGTGRRTGIFVKANFYVFLDTSAPPPVYAPAGFGAPGEGSLMRPPDSENLFNRDHVGIQGVLNEKNRTKKRPILQ